MTLCHAYLRLSLLRFHIELLSVVVSAWRRRWRVFERAYGHFVTHVRDICVVTVVYIYYMLLRIPW